MNLFKMYSVHHYVCHLLATGRWFSPGTPVSPINKTNRHDITEIVLKVTLNTINQATNQNEFVAKYTHNKPHLQ